MEENYRERIQKSLKLKKVGQKCQECGSTNNRVINRTDLKTEGGWTPTIFLACDYCGFTTLYSICKLTYNDPEVENPHEEVLNEELIHILYDTIKNHHKGKALTMPGTICKTLNINGLSYLPRSRFWEAMLLAKQGYI